MRTEILPVVQYLADKGKIHQIHMRNVRGGLHDFAEVYHDEGDTLANTLAPLGVTLPAGSVIMTGALHAMVPVQPGDVFRIHKQGGVAARLAIR